MPLFPPQWFRKTRGTHRRGTRAAQPLATDVLSGSIYYVTDETVLERSNGTIWQSYSAAVVSPYVPPTYTAGSVLFAGAGGAPDQDNTNFFFNNTTDQLKVTGSILSPLIIGGTGTTDDLTLQPTSGVGTTGSFIFFKVGNNGAITAQQIDHLGRIGMGTSPSYKLDLLGSGVDIGYVARFKEDGNAGSTWIQIASPTSGANGQAGFSLVQTPGGHEWRFAALGSNGEYAWRVTGDGLDVLIGTLTGNIIINNAITDPTTGSKCLIFGDGTAPSGLDSNTAGLYANDVGGTVNMFAINEAGVINQLTAPDSTYTPTRSAEVNLDANVTPSVAQYMRNGNYVTVSGQFTADPTTPAVVTSFELSLPIASNIGAVADLAGVAFCGAIAGQGAAISGSIANNTAVFNWVAGDVTSQLWSYIYSYSVI